MAKLSSEDWAKARAKWERSSKDGFQWLADEIGIDRSVISRRAKNENWCKKSTEKDTQRAKKYTVKRTGDNKESSSETIDNSVIVESGKYKVEYDDVAYGLSLGGYTIEQIAASLGVAKSTITEWRSRYQNFNDAIIRGRDQADAEMLTSFFNVATGKIKIVEEKDVMHPVTGDVVTLETKRTALPNVKAMIHWMFNREKLKDYWSNGEGKNNDPIIEIDAKEIVDLFNESMEKAREKYNLALEKRQLQRGITIDGDSELLED